MHGVTVQFVIFGDARLLWTEGDERIRGEHFYGVMIDPYDHEGLNKKISLRSVDDDDDYYYDRCNPLVPPFVGDNSRSIILKIYAFCGTSTINIMIDDRR